MATSSLLSVEPYSVWRHAKSGQRCTVVCAARCGRNVDVDVRMVVYFAQQLGFYCYRTLEDFLASYVQEAATGDPVLP